MTEITNINHPPVSEILNALLKHKNLTVSELARRILIPQPTIQRIVSGLHARPHKKTLELLANYFEITVDQMAGIEPITWLVTLKSKNQVRKVPLLNNEQILSLPTLTQAKLSYVSLDIDASKHAFAMRMMDESMEPVIPKQSILIVDPEKKKGYRSFVIIKPKNSDEIIVRQMIKDVNTYYIRAVGLDFSNINMALLGNNDKVLGVVVEVRVQLVN